MGGEWVARCASDEKRACKRVTNVGMLGYRIQLAAPAVRHTANTAQRTCSAHSLSV